MPLANLATQADVAALLGRPLTTSELLYVDVLLTKASAIVRNYARQDFSAVTADAITVNGTWGSRITLPQRPVTAIGSIVVAGSGIAVGTFAWDRYGNIDRISASANYNDFDNIFVQPGVETYGSSGGLYNLNGPAGSITDTAQAGPSWYGPAARITITYDHGITAVPDDVANEVAGMVAAQSSVPVGVLNEQIGGYKVGYIRAPGGAMTLTEATKDVLNKYRRRATTVSVGIKR